MKFLPFALFLLTALPASAQSPLYTNADLGHRLSPNRVTVTAEDLESLRQHQYHAPPPPLRQDGPTIFVIDSSVTAGPFGEFAPFPPPRRLDGTSYDQLPWIYSTYVGPSYRGFVNRAPYGRVNAVGPQTAAPRSHPRNHR